MAETSRSGSSTAIVAVVAILALALLVYFVFLRGGGAVPGVDDGGRDINIEVNPPGDGGSN